MIAGFLSLLLSALFGLVPGTALSSDGRTTAVSAVTSGVWWAGQLRGVPAGPPPAQVPKDGLWVSSTPAGTIAMSALRFTVAAGDRQPILAMPIAMLTSPPRSALPVDVTPNILACAATVDWSPPAPGTFGALAAAPAYDCSKGQVLAQVSDTTIVFDLSQFISETKRVVNIVIVPGTSPVPIPSAPVPLPIPPLPPVLLQSAFDVTFKPVTASAIEVLPADAVTADDFNFDETADDTFYDAVDSNSGFALGNPTVPTPRRRGLAVLPHQVARQVAAVKTEAQRSERIIAASVFLLLCMWAWSVANRTVVPGASGVGRPFRTLYDGDLDPVASGALPRFAASVRVGKPPSLR
jgi:hypothetical protein